MTIQEAVHTYLSAQNGLTALTDTRIYTVGGDADPGGDYVVFGVDASPIHQFSAGPTAAMASLRILAASEDNIEAAELIAAQLTAALDQFSGVMGGGSGVTVGACWLDSTEPDLDPETGLFFTNQEFQLIYEI